MSKYLSLTALALTALGTGALAMAPAHADSPGNNLSAAIGATGQGQMTWRAGVGHDWSKRWWEGRRGYLTGYWDAAYTYWEGGDEGSGAHSLSFSPVFVYQFNGQRVRPFIEAGIGVALFSSSHVADRRMGSAFQFEDRLGIGVAWRDGSRLGLRAIHYSNAGIRNPNQGIESYSLFYTRPL